MPRSFRLNKRDLASFRLLVPTDRKEAFYLSVPTITMGRGRNKERDIFITLDLRVYFNWEIIEAELDGFLVKLYTKTLRPLGVEEREEEEGIKLLAGRKPVIDLPEPLRKRIVSRAVEKAREIEEISLPLTFSFSLRYYDYLKRRETRKGSVIEDLNDLLEALQKMEFESVEILEPHAKGSKKILLDPKKQLIMLSWEVKSRTKEVYLQDIKRGSFVFSTKARVPYEGIKEDRGEWFGLLRETIQSALNIHKEGGFLVVGEPEFSVSSEVGLNIAPAVILDKGAFLNDLVRFLAKARSHYEKNLSDDGQKIFSLQKEVSFDELGIEVPVYPALIVHHYLDLSLSSEKELAKTRYEYLYRSPIFKSNRVPSEARSPRNKEVAFGINAYLNLSSESLLLSSGGFNFLYSKHSTLLDEIAASEVQFVSSSPYGRSDAYSLDCLKGLETERTIPSPSYLVQDRERFLEIGRAVRAWVENLRYPDQNSFILFSDPRGMESKLRKISRLYKSIGVLIDKTSLCIRGRIRLPLEEFLDNLGNIDMDFTDLSIFVASQKYLRHNRSLLLPLTLPMSIGLGISDFKVDCFSQTFNGKRPENEPHDLRVTFEASSKRWLRVGLFLGLESGIEFYYDLRSGS